MQGELEQSVLATLAYFDIFDYPLTANEISRYLWQYPNTISPDGLSKALNESVVRHALETLHGYFFLPGRGALIAIRERAVREVERKLAIAARACRKLRYLPFLQAVFVCNTVAAGRPDADSDIDVFVVIRRGRLWLTRLLATLLLSLCGLRRHGKKITNRICLSFYITDTALNLSPIALSPPPERPESSGRAGISISSPDIYLVYWLAQLVPIYDPNDTLKKIHEANRWAVPYAPHAFHPYTLRTDLRVDDTRISCGFKRAFEIMWNGAYGNLIELQAKGFQKARMKLNEKTKEPASPAGRRKNGRTSHVIVNDTMMKFHENDRREEFKTRWQESMKIF